MLTRLALTATALASLFLLVLLADAAVNPVPIRPPVLCLDPASPQDSSPTAARPHAPIKIVKASTPRDRNGPNGKDTAERTPEACR